MKRSVLKLSLPVLILCVLLGGIFTSPASARYRPYVSLTLTPAVYENAPIPFSWTAGHIGPRHRLVLQRPFGTAHVWKTVATLPANSGSSELPGVKLGTRRYRIAAYRGYRLLATQVASVSIYGAVPFTTLFHQSTDVVSTAQTSFSYVFYSETYYEVKNLFTVNHNTCIAVHVAFLAKGEHSGTTTMSVVQESRDPVSSSVPINATGSVDAEITPGQGWGVNVVYNNNDHDAFVYINGYAICNSTKPLEYNY